MEPLKGEDESLDAFHRGRIRILQKLSGYRFSVDAPLLADFIETRPDDELLELGTGCGVISLLLSIKPFRRVTALEIQDELFDLARRNVRLNRLERRIRVRKADLRAYDRRTKFDVVFANPPYHEAGSGRISGVPEKAVARHELAGRLGDFLKRAAACLKPDGRACFVLPARRRADLLAGLEDHGLNLRRERPVAPRPGESPNLFLSESRFEAGGTVVLPSLILYDEGGRPSEEAEAIYNGRIHAAG
jgi:tRNA1(Val) A37 N6-methylase TrmN6